MAHRGPKCGSQRAKTAKHLRAGSEKKFRNDSIEARAAYKQKLAARIMRRTKKKNRK